MLFPHPDDRYTVTSRDALYFANYIDYIGVVSRVDITPKFSHQIRAISEDRFFLDLHITFRQTRSWYSVMDLIKKGYYTQIDDKLYFGRPDGKFFCYNIENVGRFTTLVTKLNLKKG